MILKNKEKISTKKVVEMKDTVNRTSSPLLEVKGLTTRFLIKQDFWKSRWQYSRS